MRILLPHIPKCAGTSIRSQLVGDPRLVLDYNLHPTWRSKIDIEIGARRRAELKAHLKDRAEWVLFGHFDPSAFYDLDFDLQILIFRDPEQRAISQFKYFQTKAPMIEDVVRRNPEIVDIRSGNMSFLEYIKLDRIKYFYSRYYLANVDLERPTRLLDIASYQEVCACLSADLDRSFDPGVRLNVTESADDLSAPPGAFEEDEALVDSLLVRGRGDDRDQLFYRNESNG